MNSPFRERQPVVCDCGDHAFVAVTNGVTTMVSPEDAALLNQKWFAQPHRGRFRVRRAVGVGRVINLGRAVLALDDPKLLPDHINSDPLDNRRSNLRPASHRQNTQNTRPRGHRYLKGVWRAGTKYRACIKPDGRTIHLGYFDTEEDAHAAYVAAAQKLFGQFARSE